MSDEEQSFMTRQFAPIDPKVVGEQLVDCVRRPRSIMYTSFGTRFACWVVQFPRLRRMPTGGMARTTRKNFGLPVFGKVLDDHAGVSGANRG